MTEVTLAFTRLELIAAMAALAAVADSAPFGGPAPEPLRTAREKFEAAVRDTPAFNEEGS